MQNLTYRARNKKGEYVMCTGESTIIKGQCVNQVLVSAIANGARAIHTDICIEGIEDRKLGDYLQRYDPTYYQGYYYSKPVAKGDFLSLISS